MSRIRRHVTAFSLAAILALAATPRPVTAHALSSLRTAPARIARPSPGVGVTAAGFLDGAWSWLHHLWAEASSVLDTPPPPSCGSDPVCRTADEGPIIDPNGHH